MAETKQDRPAGPGPARDEATTANGGREVDAYEEDWYRSLKALAERRSLLDDDEQAEPEAARDRLPEAEALEGTPEATEAVPTTAGTSEHNVEEAGTTAIIDATVEAATAPISPLQTAPAETVDRPPETTPPSASAASAAPPAPAAPPVDHAAERRRELTELSSGAIGEPEAARLAALALDPDPEVRQQALATLSGHVEHVDQATITRALDDPVEHVRVAAVRLAAEAGPGCLPALARLISARQWPLTQRAALEVLPDVFASHAVDRAHIDEILEAIGQLEPGPDDDERALLGAFVRVIGAEELVASLDGPDARRLGAVRLLADDGSDAARRALAALVSDPVEEIRDHASGAAATLSEGSASSGSNASSNPSAPAPRAPVPTEQLDRVASLALSLSDPDGSVRHLALSGLGGVDRTTVLTWIRDAIVSQDQALGWAVIATATQLGLGEVAADVLGRAADLARQDRQRFVEHLASVGLEMERLVALLPSVEESRKPEAIGMMWDLLGPDVLPLVRSFLDDPSIASRLAALEVLGRSDDPDSASLVATVLRRDVSPIVRAAAIRAATRLRDPIAATSIREAITDPDAEVRRAAVEAIPQQGEGAAVEPLMEALSDADERVRRAAAHHLASTTNSDRDLVWQALLRLSPDKRGPLIETFERAKPGGLSDLALEALRSLDHEERLLAVEVVGWGLGQVCVEAAIHALLDPWAPARCAATEALARLKDPSAAGALGKALGDPDAEVRLGVVRALGMIDDEAVLGFLVSALSDPDPNVCRAASEVLTEWSSPAVAKRLAGVLAVPALRGPASDLLTRMGPTCAELLIDVLIQGHPGVAPTVGELMQRIVGLDEMIARLDSIDPDRRLRAVEAVGAIGGDEVVDVLIRTLSDPDERIRIRSAQLLGELGAVRAVPALHAAQVDPVPAVLVAVEEALSQFPGEALAAGM